MFMIVGFAVGYALGAKAGQEGLNQLVKAWQDIQRSDEFAALIETGRGLISQVAHQVVEMGTSEMKEMASRRPRAA